MFELNEIWQKFVEQEVGIRHQPNVYNLFATYKKLNANFQINPCNGD